ncbi:MAG: hypothetical protein AAF587_43780 [Bacteroidota bacterium]
MTKLTFTIFLCCVQLVSLFGQSYQLKKDVQPDEVLFLKQLAHEMTITDQQYRNYLAKETLDESIIARIDSVYEADGIEAGILYEKSLDLSLEKSLADSLWQLQHAIDFMNHLALRGIFETYGYLPKELLDKDHYVQILLLMHPPKDWNIEQYLKEYSELLLAEVQADRMAPKEFASFVDNMKGKILREPQLYGTNFEFDAQTQSVQPPTINNLKESNAARKEIGLPPLLEGEYRLPKGEDAP